jgi:hypothetical protein
VLPLRYVAMGLLVVFLRADFGGYDALADPVGWALVVGALWRLRRTPVSSEVLTWSAWLALVAAVATYLPAVHDRLDADGQWAVSLPQLAFCALWCGALVPVALAQDDQEETDDARGRGHRRARWLQLLRWSYVVLAAAPVVVLGGHVEVLTGPLAVLAVVTDVALVYLTFAVGARRRGVVAPVD